VKKNTLGVY